MKRDNIEVEHRPEDDAVIFRQRDDDPELVTDGGEPRSPARVGRHEIEETVSIAGGPERLESDGINHISGDVTISVSGAEKDRPATYRLLEEIQAAVEETVADFDVDDAKGGE